MSTLKLKLIATAAALFVGGTAMASTNINPTTGDLFLNVVDTVGHTSFVLDTGIAQSAFSGNGSYSFDFSADASWNAFLSAASGHALEFSVISSLTPASPANSGTVFFTGITAPTAVAGAAITQAQNAINAFATGANGLTSTAVSGGATAAYANNSTLSWDNPLQEGVASTQLFGNASSLGAAPGTAPAFYSEATVNGRSNTILATLNTFAGSWNLNGGVLTYSAVPLPAPLVLLLSGLGLMGLVARRRKGDVHAFVGASA